MHTSEQLIASDFQFRQQTMQASRAVDFANFCPDYHARDRIGVVSPCLEDGVYHTSYALLALTTAFYDRLRSRFQIGEFFDYPQHFAFVGAIEQQILTRSALQPPTTPHLWDAWSWLDVWPHNKWITAPVTATGMIQCVFDYQINRLFWPRTLQPSADEAPLPAYVVKMLRTHLSTVYLYDNTEATAISHASGQIEILVQPSAARIAQESQAKLPGTPTQSVPASQRFVPISTDDFLQMFAV